MLSTNRSPHFPWGTLTILVLALATVYYIIASLTPWFVDGYDPYYHHAHAHTYITGHDFNMPQVSSYTADTDLYYLYHILLAPLTVPLLESDPYTTIALSKLLHALFAGLVFGALYILSYIVLLRANQPTVRERAKIYALIAVWFAFAASVTFDFRLLVERPHVISILLTISAYIAHISRRYVVLFALSIIAPLMYSISIVLLVPIVIDLTARLIYDRTLKPLRTYGASLPIALGGLAGGIALHPASIDYVYNGIVVHLQMIITNIVEGAYRVKETAAPGLTPKIMIWLLPLVLVTAHLMYTSFQRRSLAHMSPQLFALVVITVIFALGYAQVLRMLEYLIPFLAPTIVLYVTDVLIHDHHLSARAITSSHAKGHPVQGLVREVASGVTPALRPLTLGILTAYSLASIGTLAFGSVMNDTPERYKGISVVISEQFGENRLVFNPQFHTYPRLTFFAPEHRYTLGMGFGNLYAHDPVLARIMYQIIADYGNCAPQIPMCEGTIDLHVLTRNTIGTSIVILDGKLPPSQLSEPAPDPSLHPVVAQFMQDDRFILRHTSGDDGSLFVFEARPEVSAP